MEQYIPISALNDFLYSPQSLYLHSIYQSFHTDTYHSHYQKNGNGHHVTIEDGSHGSAKRYLYSLPVSSEEYHLIGKIDMYDMQTKTLIERKAKIKKIYQGHIYQLYAQMICMEEMGYAVGSLVIRSLEDNKQYPIELPTESDKQNLKQLVEKIFLYNPLEVTVTADERFKSEKSIYKELGY